MRNHAVIIGFAVLLGAYENSAAPIPAVTINPLEPASITLSPQATSAMSSAGDKRSIVAVVNSRAATFLGAPPQVFGGNLLHVYIVWIAGVIVLCFPCAWFAGVKSRRKDLVWLRYL